MKGHKYQRGDWHGWLVKLIVVAVFIFSVVPSVLQWIMPGPPPRAAPPVVPAVIDPPGLDVCRPDQLEGRTHAVDARFSGWTIGKFSAVPDWLCRLTRFRICEVTWQSYEVFVCTDAGTPISALEFAEGTARIRNVDKEKVFNEVNPRFNCHGDSFADDLYWINPPEVEIILRDDYREILLPEVPQADDIVVYRESDFDADESRDQHCRRQKAEQNGVALHSTTLVRENPAMTFGKRGIEPIKQRLPIGPGPGASWDNPDACVTYYRRKPV